MPLPRTPSFVRRTLLASSLLCAAAGAPRTAFADDPVSQAASLYDRALSAQERGDYGAAGRLFAQADELSPDPAALEAALGAALRADDAALGMTLVERSARGPVTGSLAQVVRTAQSQFADRAGLLRVDCGGCTLVVDGRAFPDGVERWVAAGEHAVSGMDGAYSGETTVTVPGGDRVTITLDLPGRKGPARAPRAESGPADGGAESGSRGLSPAWFGVGVGLTVLGGGATLASGLDTLAIHDDFEATPTEAIAERGQSAESRTYVLGGLTAAVAVGTLLIGLFAVEWEPEEAHVAPLVVPLPGGGGAGFGGRF